MLRAASWRLFYDLKPIGVQFQYYGRCQMHRWKNCDGGRLAYFVAARSLALLEPIDGVAVFWPAAGVASGLWIALGSSARWPVVVGVVAATISANLLGDTVFH